MSEKMSKKDEFIRNEIDKYKLRDVNCPECEGHI